MPKILFLVSFLILVFDILVLDGLVPKAGASRFVVIPLIVPDILVAHAVVVILAVAFAVFFLCLGGLAFAAVLVVFIVFVVFVVLRSRRCARSGSGGEGEPTRLL